MSTSKKRLASLSTLWLAGMSAVCLLPLTMASQAWGTVSPELVQQWESQAETYGKKHCQALQNGSGAWDYDAQRVYYQLAAYNREGKYVGDPVYWRGCANLAESKYRDGYVLPNDGAIPGIALFAHGLKLDVTMGTQDQASLDAVKKLAENSQWGLNGWDVRGQNYDQAQGIAQTLLGMVDYLELTKSATRPTKYDDLVTQSLAHIDQWFVDRLWMEDGNDALLTESVGMTLQALIEAHSYQPDPRIPAKIKVALDGLWSVAWRANEKAFIADSRWPFTGDPTHNLLLAPAYAWYYKYTVDNGAEDATYRDRADLVFEGGVLGTTVTSTNYLDSPNYFNENYMWSPRYVAWRLPPGAAPQPAPSPEPAPAPTPAPISNHTPVCKNAKVTPSVLWPPNNKLVGVQVYDVTDEDGDQLVLQYGEVSQNEPVTGIERDDPAPDAQFAKETGKWYLRAQRNGNGSGREYTVPFTAHDGKGGTCEGTVKVVVPHSKGEPVAPSSQRYNSMSGK